MEDRDYFTFKNGLMIKWLAGVVIGAVAAVVFIPPAFWLCGVGAALLVVGQLSNSARTGQWHTWENWEPKLSWFEGWLVSTGAILMILPLAAVIVRAWATR